MSGKYFISYSSVDGFGAAEWLYTEAAKLKPPILLWWDKQELQPSEVDWDDQIDDALADCRGVIFLMSNDSVRRNSVCAKEWKRALRQYRKPVVIVQVHQGLRVPFGLEGRHFLTCTDEQPRLGELHQFLCSMETPAGKVREVALQIADAERDLSRARDDHDRKRIQSELDYLNGNLAHWAELASTPEAVIRAREERVRNTIELERQSRRSSKFCDSARFINPPPAIAPSYFQDRLEETRQVAQFIRDPSQRVLTIVGRGGIGKTALTCRLLKALESGKLPDGLGILDIAGIVYLSGAGGHRITAPRIYADLLRLLPEDDARQLTEIYERDTLSLKQKYTELLLRFPADPVVVLLDNFEDVIDPETRRILDPDLYAVIERILQQPHHAIKLIITTRIPAADLMIIEPGRQRRFDLDEGLPSPFAENILREMDSDGKLGLRDASGELLREARERTRGFPRALEALFATLSADRSVTLSELLADSERYLPELVVEKLVGEAYKRLDGSSQLVMQALGIYGRPVTPNAVDYMLLSDTEVVDSARVLKHLANMYFVRREGGLYYLHPVDARHVLSKVSRYGVGSPRSLQILTRRGADYFAQIRKPESEWLTLADIDPILAEFDLRCNAKDFDSAAAIASRISFDFLLRWGHYHLILGMNQRLQGNVQDRWLQGQAIGAIGYAHRNLGHCNAAIDAFEQALDVARELGSQNSIATWLTNLGATCDQLGQTERSIEYHREALLIDRRRGDLNGIGIDYHNLALRYAELGELSQAIDLIEQSIGIARKLRNDRPAKFDYAIGLRLGTYAQLLTDAGRFEEALEMTEESLELALQLKSPEISCRSWGFRAMTLLQLKRFAEADRAANEAQVHEFPRLLDYVVCMCGLTALCNGDRISARDKWIAAIGILDQCVQQIPESYFYHLHRALAACGLVACGMPEKMENALQDFRIALRLNSHTGMQRRTAVWLAILESVDTTSLVKHVFPTAVRQSVESLTGISGSTDPHSGTSIRQ